MIEAVPISLEIAVQRVWENPDLIGNKSQHLRGRLFAGTQFAARITQVAKHERMTKPVWVATAASDRSQVGVGQRIVAHQFALIGRRIEQLHDLGVGQMLSSCHSCLPDLHGGRPSDPSQ